MNSKGKVQIIFYFRFVRLIKLATPSSSGHRLCILHVIIVWCARFHDAQIIARRVYFIV